MSWKNDGKLRIQIGDIVILTGGLLISLIVLLCIRHTTGGAYIEVTVDRKVTSYSLHKDQTIRIESQNGGRNELVIENGSAYMKSADCPDQICVNHKAISKNGESIICLPHAVYVEVISDQKNDIDN